jgi:glycosyltransferase involved in cell wall biosynthesis
VRLAVTIDHRFDRTPDGVVWSMTSFSYSFWRRYLDVFDHVQVVARVRDVASVASNQTRADGDGVSFAAVPYYIGPLQYLQRAWQVQRAAQNGIGARDAVIMRISGQISSSVEPFLRRTGHPYGVEVVGDPYDAWAPGYVTHPLRPLLRWWFPRRMRRQCAGACAAAYVTEHTLQRRYPPAPDAFSTHYSSIVLPESAFASAARSPRPGQRALTLVIVGTLDNLSKGPDTSIDAVGTCVQEGLDLQLLLVGGGKYQPELETRAEALGLGNRVRFLGWVSAGEAVRAQLDKADLFVLPSRQEGLSRATIEAMARALPCVCSTVGGTSELLPREDMVPCGDVAALARKIREVVTNPERMARMSASNLEKAKEYREEILRERWTAFYRYVRERTEEWLPASGRGSFTS